MGFVGSVRISPSILIWPCAELSATESIAAQAAKEVERVKSIESIEGIESNLGTYETLLCT